MQDLTQRKLLCTRERITIIPTLYLKRTAKFSLSTSKPASRPLSFQFVSLLYLVDTHAKTHAITPDKLTEHILASCRSNGAPWLPNEKRISLKRKRKYEKLNRQSFIFLVWQIITSYMNLWLIANLKDLCNIPFLHFLL